MFDLILPISGLQLNAMMLFVVGVGGGLVSNILGIGGGVFVTPMLVMLGVSPGVAFPSQLNASIGTHLMGFCAHFRRNDVDLAMANYVIIGGVIGAIIEFFGYRYISFCENSLKTLNIIYVISLTCIGVTMLMFHIHQQSAIKKTKATVTMKKWMLHLPLHRVFIRSRVEMSILIPLFIGIITGMCASLLGGGISMLLTPAIGYLIGRESPVVQGTARLSGFVIAIVVASVQSFHHAVGDWIVILLLLFGGALGSQIARSISVYFSRAKLGMFGAIALLFLAAQFFYALLFPVKILVPLPKIHLTTTAFLYDTLQSSTGWPKILLQFAFDSPVLYTWLGIIGIIFVALVIERIVRQSVEKFSNYTKETFQ